MGESCARDLFLWDATNKSVRFTGGNLSRQGFWRHWGVWGDRSPRSFLPQGGGVRGGGIVAWQRLMALVGAITLGVLLEFIAWVLLWTCVWPREPIDMSWE